MPGAPAAGRATLTPSLEDEEARPAGAPHIRANDADRQGVQACGVQPRRRRWAYRKAREPRRTGA